MRLEVISLWRRLWNSQPPPAQPEHPIPMAQVVEVDVERRLLDRQPCHREAWLHPVSLVKANPWHAIVLDMSTVGIGLAIERPVLAGTFFAVELPDPMLQNPPKMVRARVVYAKSQTRNYWHLGCVFETELTQEELDILL